MAFPFQLRPNGTVMTTTQGSDQYNNQMIAVLALTRTSERALADGFGISDPHLSGFVPTELAAAVVMWGPDVEITNVTQTYTSPRDMTAVIEWQ